MRWFPVLLLALTVSGARAESVLDDETVETFAAAVGAERLAAWEKDAARLDAAFADCEARLDRPTLGIVIPWEIYPNGQVQYEVKAGRAQFFKKENLVWCGEVTVNEYSAAGVLKTTCSADACVIDQKTKSCWLKGTGRIVIDGKTGISGDGIYFSSGDFFVKIQSKVTVETSAINFKGVQL